MLVTQLRLETVGGDHELDRDDIRALVQELEEGMLAVGPGSPQTTGPEEPSTGAPSMTTPLPFDSMSSCWR